MLKIECSKETCHLSELCGNMRLQKAQNAPVKAFRTVEKGWGLEAAGEISKGQFVIEYSGEIINSKMCIERIKSAQEKNIDSFYMLTISKDMIVDARLKGNLARFMNHSCNPNCQSEKWNVNGDTRIGLYAIRDIRAYEELTFDYQLDSLGNEKLECKCFAENCSGFIGLRPLTPLSNLENKSVGKGSKRKFTKDSSQIKNKKIKRNKLMEGIEHENECFICNDGGILILCDICPKVYHLDCLNRPKLPRGEWRCPWHFCDVCGQLSTIRCSDCSNSFCMKHSPQVADSGKEFFVCGDHSKNNTASNQNLDLLKISHDKQIELNSVTKVLTPKQLNSTTVIDTVTISPTECASNTEIKIKSEPNE